MLKSSNFSTLAWVVGEATSLRLLDQIADIKKTLNI